MSRRHLLPPRSTSKHTLTSKECGNSHLTLGCIRGGSLGLWGSKYSQNLECRDYKYFAHLGWCATIYFILPNRILYLTQFRKFEKLPLPVVWPGYPSVHMRWRDNGDTQHASEDQRFYGHNSRDCFPPPDCLDPQVSGITEAFDSLSWGVFAVYWTRRDVLCKRFWLFIRVRTWSSWK